VCINEKSANLRKDILETANILRNSVSKMRAQLENKSEENKRLNEEVRKGTEEMARMRDSQPVRLVAPSLDHMQQTPRRGARRVPPSAGRRRKFLWEAPEDEGYLNGTK
jgi:hypothetical protein